MNADVEQCASNHYHGAHYWASNKRYCPGIYRELADAVRAWNDLMRDAGNAQKA